LNIKHKIVEANNGEEAIKILKEEKESSRYNNFRF
jgi:hypothetical protein